MRYILTPCVAATLTILAGCSSPTPEAGNAVAQPSPAPSPASGGKEAPRLTSKISGLMISASGDLPKAPAEAGARDDCAHLLSDPKTAAGREVAERGWGVTGEAKVGDYQAVSFVGSFERGTSGSCLLGKGNVALFKDGKLAALAWMKPGSPRSLARIETLGDDRLRLWDGDFLSQPFADLVADATGTIAAIPMAEKDAVCGGKAEVPNLYGVPIATARARLARHGWTPGEREASGEDSGAVGELVANGVTEVDDCSGTGFGFCRFTYGGAAGTLSVTTVGEGDRPVAGYDVSCT
ncbi:hypothetical protein [Sphingomonas rustica]